MQYIIDYPTRIKWGEYKAGIWDIDGNFLGNISHGAMEGAEVRFEDDHGVCHGTLRKKNKKSFAELTNHSIEILGPLEDLRGIIEIPYWSNRATQKYQSYHGPRILYDVSGGKIAASGTFSYHVALTLDPLTIRFEHLRKNGLYFKTSEGAIIATIKDSRGLPGCQIDLFPPIPDGLSIFSLVVHVLIL
jgi:hypothetical protein